MIILLSILATVWGTTDSGTQYILCSVNIVLLYVNCSLATLSIHLFDYCAGDVKPCAGDGVLCCERYTT